MPSTRQGSIHLFRFAGIDVFLHWSWFLVAVYEIQSRKGSYSSVMWNVFEYLALFMIVLTHEFGHALACRQVGGRANQIILWPLGGIAYVDPPPRAGATLWSIAAGPLVNVVLIPILASLAMFSGDELWVNGLPNTRGLLPTIFWINFGLLAFNILPIYPLDGGQILRSLLWFVFGRARSLMVAAVIGLIGAIGFIAWAVLDQSIWMGAIAAFVLLNCWSGLQQARALLRLSKIPRREGYSCPTCHAAPPLGTYWKCRNCGQPFDSFATAAACPNCHSQFPATQCLDCGRQHPSHEWASVTLAGVGTR